MNEYPDNKPGWVDPSKQPRTCQVEGCGVTRPLDEMIYGHMVVSIPGHTSVPPFQCGKEEHWACSIEHFSQVHHTCIDEHIKKALYLIHSQIPESVHNAEAQAKVVEAQ